MHDDMPMMNTFADAAPLDFLLMRLRATPLVIRAAAVYAICRAFAFFFFAAAPSQYLHGVDAFSIYSPVYALRHFAITPVIIAILLFMMPAARITLLYAAFAFVTMPAFSTPCA